MNYLTVPDSKLKLVDGNVVMLERFPGLKWILHNGWYSYNGRQYMGWYFTSIPSQTILPVSNQDLRMITLVSSKSNDEYPDYPPAPPEPYDHHGHHGHHGHGHGHCPPVYPPVAPDPEPEKPAFFSQTCKNQLDSAFISVPTLKKRDQLDTSTMPDGKIVRVNSVDGEPRYYAWSAFNDHWEELHFVLQENVDDQLANYYDATQINQYIEDANRRIDDVNTLIADTSERLQHDIDDAGNSVVEVERRIRSVESSIAELQAALDSQGGQSAECIAQIQEQVAEIESAINDIQRVSQLIAANTILVSDSGSIADSGIAIGGNEITAPSEYASGSTLATEKAVAKKFEEAQPKWASF